MHDGREVIAAGTYWIRRQQADRDECWYFGCLSRFPFYSALVSSPWNGASHSESGTSHLRWPSLETSSQTRSEVCLLSDSGCYQHEPSPWFIALPPAEMTGCRNYTWLWGAGVLTQGFVMLGRSSPELHKPVSLALSVLVHVHDVSSYLTSLLSWTWHHVIIWLLGNSCHVHSLVMCVFATVDILLPSVVVCNGMSVVWIYVTNCVCWFYNPLNAFLYFYYFIYTFPIEPHSVHIKRI